MAEDSAARFRASLDKLLYYDKDSGTAPRATDAFGGVDAADALAENPSNPGAITSVHPIRRHEARPGDRRDYLRRVATFRPAVWFAKPEGLRPVDCARRGWTCVGVDTLECESCKARLLFAVPPTASSDDAKKLATMTQPRLDQNHEPSCGWRGTTCPASVARFPRVPDETLRDEFRARRDALLELEHVPEVCAITSAVEDDGCTTVSGRFAPAAVAKRLARLATSATSIETDLSTAASRETESPARLRAATVLALCGWTVAKREASSETKVDATLAASPAWSPSPRRGARRASLDGKVTGSILRCALCDAKAATWNFADARETSSSARRFGTAAGAGASPYQKKKPVASATALMGAMGGAFGPSVFDAAPPEPNPAGPGPGSGNPAGSPAPAGGSETNGNGNGNGNGNPPVMSLGLSIAGGGTPSRAALGAGPFGAAAASPPAFGAGAARDAPFGAPGGLVRSPAPVASAKRKRDDSSSEGASGGIAARTSVPTPAPASLPTPAPPRSPAASSVLEIPGAFHPLRRHRAHCPWSAPFVSSSEGDFRAGAGGFSPSRLVAAQPGWQCVLDAVAPFESADGDAADAAGRAAPGAPDDRNDPPRGKKPPGRLEEYSDLSGRNAVASYLAGGA